MNKRVIDLVEKDVVDAPLLIQQLSKGVNASNDYYLVLLLQDQSGSIDSRLWHVKEEDLEKFKVGMIVRVQGTVISHRKALQLKISSIEEVDMNDIDLQSFVKCGPYSAEFLKEAIYKVIDEMQDSLLKGISKGIVDEYQEQFFTYPAAMKNHHDHFAGLATHVYGMLKIAEGISEYYDFIDKDLLNAGIILHDIGKIFELSGVIGCEYTVQGNLLGHITIVENMINEYAHNNGYDVNEEKLMLLKHMVLAHHGKNEYGSPVLPMIPEAELLYLIDNMDARMQSFKKALDGVEAGGFTPRIFALENRMLYKRKGK